MTTTTVYKVTKKGTPTKEKIDYKAIYAEKKSKFDNAFKEYKKLKEQGLLPDNLGKMYYKQNGGEYQGANPRLMYMQGAKAGVYVPMNYLYTIKRTEGTRKDGTKYKRPKKIYKYDFDFTKAIMVCYAYGKEFENEDGEIETKTKFGYGMVIHEDNITPKERIKEEEEAMEAIKQQEAMEQETIGEMQVEDKVMVLTF